MRFGVPQEYTDSNGHVWYGTSFAFRANGKEDPVSDRGNYRQVSIGTEFHRWVCDHADGLGLRTSADLGRFIERDFGFCTRQYDRLRTAATVLNPQLECVYYNAQQNLTFQYAVLLAPLRMTDSEQEVTRKLRVAAAYVDILIARQVWKFQAIDYSTM